MVVLLGADIIMQRALVALQRQGIVAALLNDLLSDHELAVQRVGGHDRANASIFSCSGTAVISLDLASVAICANTSRCSQPQALTM